MNSRLQRLMDDLMLRSLAEGKPGTRRADLRCHEPDTRHVAGSPLDLGQGAPIPG